MTLTQINKAGLDEIALDHVFTIGASGSSAYTFQGEGLNGTVNNPTLYLTRGKTYRFENGSGGHPIRIQSTSGASGTAYNTGVTNNAGSGTVIVEVQHDAPDVLYYQCTSHAAMNGILYITGALADGGVTTAKLADDAVTDAKLANSINSAIAANTAKTTNATHTGDVTGSTSLTIANDAVTTAKIADDAVTTAKLAAGSVDNTALANNSINGNKLQDNCVATSEIQDEAVTLAKLPHGTSSNDGKFLRANNGADPSFETVSIPDADRIVEGNSVAEVLDTGNNGIFRFLPEGSEVFRITHEGKVGIGTTNPSTLLELSGSGNAILTVNTGNNSGDNSQIAFGDSADADVGFINYDHGTNAMQFRVNASERMRIDSSGQVSVKTNGLNLENATATNSRAYSITNAAGSTGWTFGNGVLASAHQFVIYDNSAGAGRMLIDSNGIARFNNGIQLGNGLTNSTAHQLDDYEEGSWTPTMTNTGSLSNGVAAGRYTKIGRMVHFVAYLSWSARSNNGNYNIKFQSLPFTCASYFRFPIYVGGQEGFTDDNGNTTHIAGSVLANTTEGQFRISSSDAHNEVSFTGGSGSTGSGYIYWGGTYYIN